MDEDDARKFGRLTRELSEELKKTRSTNRPSRRVTDDKAEEVNELYRQGCRLSTSALIVVMGGFFVWAELSERRRS